MSYHQRKHHSQRIVGKQNRILKIYDLYSHGNVSPSGQGRLRKTHALNCSNRGCSCCGAERAAKRYLKPKEADLTLHHVREMREV